MNNSSVRATHKWKTKLFHKMRTGMIFTVFSTGITYGKRIYIVVARRSGSLEVIELTHGNVISVITNKLAERSVIAYEDFISETFNIVDPPSLAVNKE